jgi:hypothetical protein
MRWPYDPCTHESQSKGFFFSTIQLSKIKCDFSLLILEIEKPSNIFEGFSTANNGGGERDRTDDLLRARQALSQLSYTPIFLRGGPRWT